VEFKLKSLFCAEKGVNIVRTRIVLCAALVLSVASFSRADNAGSERAGNIWRRQTLTGNFFGLGDRLSDSGIEVGLVQVSNKENFLT
jgi:hypothetical protein